MMNQERSEERNQKVNWFMDCRFGLFIHWGIYSIPARGEWVKSHERMDDEEYDKYMEEFNPKKFHPEKWAEAAINAGMKYAVMTAKHSDGFCMFDSQYTDYKITNTPAGADLLKQYIDAFRNAGLKIGIYYSLLDWHHKDYPAYGDWLHPKRDDQRYNNNEKNFANYLTYMHDQIMELMTHYGKIDILWLDFSYRNMTGEVWQATDLVKKVKSLQPHIILCNRLGGDIKSENPETYAGDFASPEQIIPPKGVFDNQGNALPWEACVTSNDNWGYTFSDQHFKNARQIIRALVECTSKGGNLLLNVGPNAMGEIPQPALELLSQVGKWMKQNSPSIYGCSVSQFVKPQWGRYTQKKGTTLYAHVYDRGIGPIVLEGLNNKIRSIRLLIDGSEVEIYKPLYAAEYPDDAFIQTNSVYLPDEIDTVFEIELL